MYLTVAAFQYGDVSFPVCLLKLQHSPQKSLNVLSVVFQFNLVTRKNFGINMDLNF